MRHQIERDLLFNRIFYPPSRAREHDNMRFYRWLLAVLPTIGGFLMPAFLPVAHIAVLYYFWNSYTRYVDRRFCTCSCWDTVFKLSYEKGIPSYKHLYFNATPNSVRIWILIVSGIVMLHECNKYLIRLLMKRTARYSMVVLFLSSIFSHYYAWWAYLNYYNDDFYSQWNHQLFFTVTEVISTVAVLHLANAENVLTSRKILCIVGVSLLHIVAGGFDQFVTNVIKGEGYAHQVVRDLGFMIPDLLHLFVSIGLLCMTRRKMFTCRPFYRDLALQKEIVLMLAAVIALFIFCSFL